MFQESRLYYLFKVRVYLVASIQFVISLLPFLKFINLNYIVVMQMAVFIAVFVLAIHEYFFGAVTFILTMFKLHRFEFERHACRTILLSSAILLSILSSLFGFYFTIVVSSCLIAQGNMGIINKLDLCFNIFPVNLNPEISARLYFWFISFELLPFIFYFILDKPHDCFICLGKDPDRRFSKF